MLTSAGGQAAHETELPGRWGLSEGYGAPHVALLFMPSFGDNVRVGGDMGIYGQTFWLSLTAHCLWQSRLHRTG